MYSFEFPIEQKTYWTGSGSSWGVICEVSTGFSTVSLLLAFKEGVVAAVEAIDSGFVCTVHNHLIRSDLKYCLSVG
jgi:hypothetical protein